MSTNKTRFYKMEPHLNKENVGVASRLPLPQPPLPPLPQHLIKKGSDRPPLSTIADSNTYNGPKGFHPNQQNPGGSETAKTELIGKRPKSPYKMDMRFVTVKRGCEDFIAHENEARTKSDPSIICISSDDEKENTETSTYFSDKDCYLYRRASASTPGLQSLQPARLKNVKRSLKRPHSRELQGISQLRNRVQGEDSKVKRRLHFNQSVNERMLSPDPLQRAYMEAMDHEYTADILSNLLQAERKPAVPPRVRNETRACLINWLMKINGLDGKPVTIQTALWYLDAVLSSGHVALENMQLVGAACYWIATKIQGPAIPASKLVKYANHAFGKQRLLEAEQSIMKRLKFPRPAVVPQDFINYFAWWCNRDRPGEIEVAATFLCLCGMMVNKSLCHEYPSVVAASSIRNALLLLRKKELMPRLQSCFVFVAAEQKASNVSHTCAILRHAVRTVASKEYGYKFIFEQYGTPPKYIAQTIVSAANELAILDSRSSAMIF